MANVVVVVLHSVIVLVLSTSATLAFAPPALSCQSPLSVQLSSSAFDEYELGATTELAILDTAMGDESSPAATAGDIVTVEYEGRLLQSNIKFDEGTFSFKLGEGKVIAGWDRGLEGLRVGGKRTIKIPPKLAYGPQGAGDGMIPPNADLVFDCELKSIASGPVAEFLAATGIGLNPRTGLLIAFVLSIVLPKFGIGEQGFL